MVFAASHPSAPPRAVTSPGRPTRSGPRRFARALAHLGKPIDEIVDRLGFNPPLFRAAVPDGPIPPSTHPFHLPEVSRPGSGTRAWVDRMVSVLAVVDKPRIRGPPVSSPGKFSCPALMFDEGRQVQRVPLALLLHVDARRPPADKWTCFDAYFSAPMRRRFAPNLGGPRCFPPCRGWNDGGPRFLFHPATLN